MSPEPAAYGDTPLAEALRPAPVQPDQNGGSQRMSHRAIGSSDAAEQSQQLAPGPVPAVRYIHAASFCFALVLLDDAIPPAIRLVVSLFGDAPSAERFARDHGYPNYVIAPAAPVLAVVSIPP
jgi:hypothetical protein